MTDFLPIYRISFFFPFVWGNEEPDLSTIRPDRNLIFNVRSLGSGRYFYICQSALAVNAREEDCRTPPFKPIEQNGKFYVPDHITAWMHGFSKVMQIGAAYQRATK